MNQYSKILHHINPKESSNISKTSSTKRRTWEELEEQKNKTELQKLQEKSEKLEQSVEFLQQYILEYLDKPKETVIIREGLLNEPPEVKNSDPLTPLDQNFVTVDELNDHYRLFINRIQQQMATIGGGGETQFKFLDDIVNFVFVGSTNDLPVAVNGVITLEDNYTYFFTKTVDLFGSRLVAGQNTTILGGSSENCRIKSTGISTTTALLSSVYSLPLRNITLEAPWAINLIASNPSVHALDWFGVNFTNCAKVGIISSYNNFIMLDGAFLNSQDLTFNGTTGTVGFNQCLFSGNFGLGGTKSILNFPNTFNCTRRIRTTVCSFVVPGGYTGITVADGASIPVESFILDTCNFSGPGTKLGISTHTDVDGNTSNYNNNRGIDNTFVVGQHYMNDNADATTFATSDTFVKIVGVTTTTGATNSKFVSTNNRLTCVAAVERRYLTQVSATILSGGSGTYKLGIYDSTDGGSILPASQLTFDGVGGSAVSVSISDVHKHISGDYVEVYIANVSSTDSIVVTDLNVLVTQLG
jgi:hypothetical protein